MTQDNLTVEKIKNRTEIDSGVYELDDGAITVDDISIIAFLLKKVESQKEARKKQLQINIGQQTKLRNAVADTVTRCAEIAKKSIGCHCGPSSMECQACETAEDIRTEFQLSKEG